MTRGEASGERAPITELLPCPFCGNDWPLLVVHSHEAGEEYSVRCYQGCCEIAGDESRDEVVKMWNTRAALSKVMIGEKL